MKLLPCCSFEGFEDFRLEIECCNRRTVKVCIDDIKLKDVFSVLLEKKYCGCSLESF